MSTDQTAKTPTTESDLDLLEAVLPDGAMLKGWCRRLGIHSVLAFTEVDITLAPSTRQTRWSRVQRALRRARDQAEAEGVLAGHRLLQRLLEPLAVAPPSPALAAALLPKAARPATPRPRRGLSARDVLSRLGGIAGARAIAEAMTAQSGEEVTVRQIRDRLRNTGDAVRKLGAGYFAVRAQKVEPVLDWVEARLEANGSEPVEGMLAAILENYPLGDARAIVAWLHQEPGRVVVRDEVVHLAQPRPNIG